MKKICIFMIRGYQKYISPMTGPHCKYTPTCSQYAIEALQKYGALKGGFWPAGGYSDVIPLQKAVMIRFRSK